MKAVRYGIDTMDDFHKLDRKAISHKRTSVDTSKAMLPCGGVLKSNSDQYDVFEYTLDCPMMSGSALRTVSYLNRERELIELSEKTMSKEEKLKHLNAIFEKYK